MLTSWVVLGLLPAPLPAGFWTIRGALDRVNREICGQVLDFTHNHGQDRRIWSKALQQKRDLYVYLPPRFDPKKQYPLAIFLHGATQDEQFFVEKIVLGFDKAMADGKLPPCIIACPDGSLGGHPSFFRIASFFANTDAGCYEDYLMTDVWNFLMETFPIRPEREWHALMGVSMGGSAAFANAIKHRDRVKIAVGFMPVLNSRWVDSHGRFMTPFDENCWGWRERVNPLEVVGRPKGTFVVRFNDLYGPTVGNDSQSIAKLSRFNPIEMLEAYDVKPGELDLFIAYGGKDEFNVAAQVDSFLHVCRQRGIVVESVFDPEGKHDPVSGRKQLPAALEWASKRLAP